MKKRRRRRRSRHAITWTTPMLAKLRRMWAKGGHTMLEIAVSLSPKGHPLSRSAVAGMIRRNGMIRAPIGPRKPKEEAEPTPAPEQAGELPSAPSAPSAPEPAPTILLRHWRVKNRIRQVRALKADGKPCILLDLGQGCKWPVGLDKNRQHLFCNKEKAGDGPYCGHHFVVATQGRTRTAEGNRHFSW